MILEPQILRVREIRRWVLLSWLFTEAMRAAETPKDEVRARR